MPFLLFVWLGDQTRIIFDWTTTDGAVDCVHELSPRPGGHPEWVCFPAGPDRILALVHQSCCLGCSTIICFTLGNNVVSYNSWTFRKCDTLFFVCHGDFHIWYIFSGMSYCSGVCMAAAWQPFPVDMVDIFHNIKTCYLGSGYTNNQSTMENQNVCYICYLLIKLLFLNKWLIWGNISEFLEAQLLHN